MNLELTASVNHIFENVKTITGKDIQLIEKPDLAAYAMIKIGEVESKGVEIVSGSEYSFC